MKKTNVIIIEDDVLMQKLYEMSIREYCKEIQEESLKESSKEPLNKTSKEPLKEDLKEPLKTNYPINLSFRKNIKEVILSFDLKTNDILVINLNAKEIDDKIELIKKIEEKNKNNKNNKQSLKIIIVFDNTNFLRKENKLSMLKLLSLNLDCYLTKDIELNKFCEILFNLGNVDNRNDNRSNNENNNESFIEGSFQELINELAKKEIKDILKKDKEKEQKKILEQINKKSRLKRVK